MSTIYLLHFEPAYKHARHYLGFTDNGVEPRVEEHRKGQGARLTQVAVAAGCQLVLVRTWEGDRTLERRFKNQNNAPRLCPLCNAKHWRTRGTQ
jgi:predicted GIY-YIG superfamily endonuclease